MSFKALEYVTPLIKDDVSPIEKLLLFVLAHYHNEKQGASWPSIPLLARVSLMSERAVYKTLGKLEAKQIIERVSTPGRGNAYRFPSIDGPLNGSTGDRCTMNAAGQAVRKL